MSAGSTKNRERAILSPPSRSQKKMRSNRGRKRTNHTESEIDVELLVRASDS
uniref:ELMO domain-containing protein C-like isoform X1 n=1 Tax=Rhizophora mucronata TaxID=61149 RepID=A0A2P2KWY7_RHIMU